MTIHLQFGQYGNQISPQFMNHYFKYCNNGSDSPFFRYSERLKVHVPRAVCVDMEPKAIINSCFKQSNESFKYLKNQAFYQQSGSGNNWAHGYQHFGPLVCDEVLDRVRREAEFVDHSVEFVSVASLAGGTGSGLSTFMIQQVREQFPNSNLITQTVLPFKSGEVNTQSYNAVLSLDKQLEFSDGIVVFGNDDATEIVMRSTLNQKYRPGLQQLNDIISYNVCFQMLGYRRPVQQLLLDAVPSPLYKLLAPRCTPSAPLSTEERKWFSIASGLRLLALSGSCSDVQTSADKQVKAAGGRVILRGPEAARIASLKPLQSSESAKFDQKTILKQFVETQQILQALTRNPQAFPRAGELTFRPTVTGFDELFCNPRAGGLLLNADAFGGAISDLTDDLIAKVARRSYLHWYERYGVEEADVLSSISLVRASLGNYEEL